jgi:hypothetical protein
MALVFKDRVKETTTTSGTGTITLAGAVSGFQTFSVIGDGNTTYYTVVSGTDWEVGIGTYTLSGTTLSRDTILESSNGGSAISLSGTSTVFCTYAAEKSVYRNSNDQINVTASGLIFSDSTVQTTAAAVSGDNVSIFVNDASYLTAESDTLQTVVDRGNTSTTDITVSGLLTAATGVTLEQNTPATTTDKLYNVGGPATTTDKLYNVGGALYFNGSAVDTTYTAGSGLELSGTTFNAKTATTSASGITTLTNTINGDQDKALTPKAVNDAGYLTSESDTLQTVVDRGSTSTTDITVSGLLTAATGVTLEQNTPATTTDKLYNVGGSLYFNGSAVDTTYTAGSGLQLNGTTFDALTATTSASGITTLTNTIDSTETKALTPKGVNDAGYVVGPASSTDNAIVRFDGTTGKLIQDTAGATIDDNNILSADGVRITAGSTNWMGFDTVRIENVTNASPQQLTFQGYAVSGTNQSFHNNMFMARLSNVQSSQPHGSAYLFFRDDVSNTWEVIQVAERDGLNAGNNETPTLVVQGTTPNDAVMVGLKGAGGGDTIQVHMQSYRIDDVQNDGDTMSMFPEFVFSNKKAVGQSEVRKIFPTQDGQSSGYYFGLGTQTDPQEALDVGGNGLFSGTVSATGLITAATGVTLQQNTPATTTDKLYNIGGNLYFNGLQLATSTSADWTIADGNGNSEVVSSGNTIYFSGVAGTDVTYDAATNIVSISGGYNPVVTETGTSRNLAAGDAGLYIRTTNASAVTITVPSGLAPPANAEFVFEQAGAGQITISPAAGVTVNTSSSLTSSAQYAVLGIKEVATDVYTAFGDRT